MSDPTRWRDGADDLPADVHASLRGARGPVPPSAADRAAIVALATRIAATPPLAPPASPWNALAKVGGWKGVGLAGLIVAAGVSLVPALRHRDAPSRDVGQAHRVAAPAVTSASSSPVTQPTTVAPAPVATVAPAAASTATRAVTPSVAPAPRARPVLPVAPVTVTPVRTDAAASRPCPAAQGASESEVLDAAMRVLASDPSLTLTCLRSLEAQGGAVALRDEYWFLGFEASRRLGRRDDARQWGQSLLQGAADSPYAARVRHWIDGTSTP